MMDIELSEDLIELQLQEEALQLAKRRAKYNGAKSIIAPIVNSLHKLNIEPSFDGDLNVHCTGDAAKLARVIRVFRTSGYSSDADRPKQGESSWVAFFTRPDCGVRIYFHFSSSVCRRVKTGTKTVEIDVYETVCGEIEDGDGAGDTQLEYPKSLLEISQPKL